MHTLRIAAVVVDQRAIAVVDDALAATYRTRAVHEHVHLASARVQTRELVDVSEAPSVGNRLRQLFT